MSEATEMQPVKPAHGTFCWNELATTDDVAARKFYGELFGWQYKTNTMPGMEYHEIHQGGASFGGMMKMVPEFGEMPPHWVAYVAVDNVDETVAKTTELGGKVCVPPMDIPNTGRFAIINDPTGATIAIITLGAS